MPSIVGWLDQSEEQQRRMREVIALFSESGTVDDIGIGVVRDAFSDLLFPGLSTVQTRVRYFFFVPWVYQRLDAEKVPSAKAAERARRWEIELITSLLAGGSTEGVIGREAREGLKQLPSFVYWSGLRAFGIRRFNGTRADYARSLDRHRRRIGAAEATEPRWHSNLPAPPDGLWQSATLDLTPEEAHYLQERIVASQPGSLLAHLAKDPRSLADELGFPWNAIDVDELPPDLRTRVQYARYFSETIDGASLLYNLSLAEAAERHGFPMGEERRERYRERLQQWSDATLARRPIHEGRTVLELWQLVSQTDANVTAPARQFITTWLRAVDEGIDVVNSNELREVIRQRERSLKKGLARLSNPRALETWGGASGIGQLSYRWAEGKAAINDIYNGLGAG